MDIEGRAEEGPAEEEGAKVDPLRPLEPEPPEPARRADGKTTLSPPAVTPTVTGFDPNPTNPAAPGAPRSLRLPASSRRMMGVIRSVGSSGGSSEELEGWRRERREVMYQYRKGATAHAPAMMPTTMKTAGSGMPHF